MSERLPWFKCNPSKLLGAMAGLTADENLVYITILLRIYDTGGPIADDAKRLARRCGMTEKRVREALEGLSEAGKISIEGCIIDSETTHETLQEMEQVKKSAKNAGLVSAERKKEKNKQNQSENLTPVDTTLSGRSTGDQRSKIEDIEKEKDISESKGEGQKARSAELEFRLQLVDVYRDAGCQQTPDGGHVAIWLARGHNPQICLAVVREGLRAKNGRFLPPKYFDQQIADAHVAPVARASPRSSPTSGTPEKSEQLATGDAVWRLRIEDFCRTKTWKHFQFSPEPGHPGCVIPAHILDEFRDWLPMSVRDAIWPKVEA